LTELERQQERAPDRPGWEYASAPESRELVTLRERYGHFVGGEWLEPNETYTTIDPSSEESLAEVGQATEQEVGLAVAAARDAFENGWSALPGSERAKYLFRIARLLQERSREFAVLESLNGGKPIRESRDVDLPLAAAHFFYYAGWADKLEYAFPNRGPKPLGVAGQIIPWNFPLLMLAWKIAPALAAGNTVVLKPAETTPLSALLFCDVLRQAELPPGVVNIVTGDGRAGAALVQAEVDKVAFTGSTEVGKAIQRELAGTGKKLTLELGGKAANVIFDDAALDQAVEGIVNGIYFNQGHVWRRCGWATRWTRTRTSARSTRASSSTRSRNLSGAGRRRAPRSTSRPAACRRRATGSCRRSSRTSRRATASRRRRSSGRCCRC
jgi:aldehyde dehydrogenase (NAD+)